MRATRGFCLLVFLFASLSQTLADSTLSNLHVDEINAFVSKPRFSWNLTSEDTQTSYRIQVSTSRHTCNNIWDSGVILSSSSLVEYAGPYLSSGTRYFWTVDVEVSAGLGIVASSDFTTSYPRFYDSSNELTSRQVTDLGTLATAFKTSTWIWTADGAPPLLLAPPGERYFRRTYVPPTGKTAVLAEIIITADNKFSLYVNGALVGISPPDPDSWEKAQGYRMALSPGPVVFAVSATNAPAATVGGVNAAGLLIAVRITHSDATQVLFGTDKTWRSNIMLVPSFQSPTLDDSKWDLATELDKFGKGPWALSVTLPTVLSAVSLPPAPTSSALPSTSSTLPLTSSATSSSLPSTTSSSTTSPPSTSSSAIVSSSTITITQTSQSEDNTAAAAASTTSNSKSGTNPAIVGGALGGVLGAFALLGIGLLFWRRRKRAQDERIAADFDTWIPATHAANNADPPSMSQVPGPSSSPAPAAPSTLRQPQYPNTTDQYAQPQSPYRYPPPSVSMAGGAGTDAYAGQYGGGYGASAAYGATGSGAGYGAQPGGYGYGQSGYNPSQEFGSSAQLVPPQNNANAVPRSLTPGNSQGYYSQTGVGSNSYDRRHY
ncbi:hypothetical protein C0995_006103 [Termitomyces sp. Mi166|nr:hypothetical protein C0995_006103 [Termitomyces sp. Mi166\